MCKGRAKLYWVPATRMGCANNKEWLERSRGQNWRGNCGGWEGGGGSSPQLTVAPIHQLSANKVSRVDFWRIFGISQILWISVPRIFTKLIAKELREALGPVTFSLFASNVPHFVNFHPYSFPFYPCWFIFKNAYPLPHSLPNFIHS